MSNKISQNIIEVTAGSTLKVQENNVFKLPLDQVSNLIVIKSQSDLHITLKDGQVIVLESFYEHANAVLQVEGEQGQVHYISSAQAVGFDLASGEVLVYAQGSQASLLEMAGANESLHVALNAQDAISSSQFSSASLTAEHLGMSAGAVAAGGVMGTGIAATTVAVGAVVAVAANVGETMQHQQLEMLSL